MNTTKRDVLELRRRLTKKDCTLSRVCGCYVGGSGNVILKFNEYFADLPEDEFYKYLEIAKKALSGSLGSNLLELSFARGPEAQTRQQFLLALKSSKLQNEDLLDRFYEQVMEQYDCPGNYLILVFHDVYDVMVRTSDRAKLDESQEIYEYMICAICPVELSRAGLGYREEENRIGVRERDWVVGAPELGFLYPAFSQRSSDVNAVLYYVKSGKGSHPEFAGQVLGCETQRTAAEEKKIFEEIVQDAFGEESDQAERVLFQIGRNLSGMIADAEEDADRPPVVLSQSDVSGMLEDAALEEEVRTRIDTAYAQVFGEKPPAAQNLIDSKRQAVGAQREQVLALEKKIETLQSKLEESPEDRAPWEVPADEVVVQVSTQAAQGIQTRRIDGVPFLLIPVDGCTTARINGVETPLEQKDESFAMR